MKNARKKRGPKEDRLVIEGDWKDAVGQALQKKKPPGGWPKPGKPKRKKRAEG